MTLSEATRDLVEQGIYKARFDAAAAAYSAYIAARVSGRDVPEAEKLWHEEAANLSVLVLNFLEPDELQVSDTMPNTHDDGGDHAIQD